MKYDHDIVIIGGGAAGLVASTAAASLGAKTAMIEKNKLGGDCTWYGCVPSKALLKAAHSLHEAKAISKYGIKPAQDMKYDLTDVMATVREVVEGVSSHHPASVFEERGIKVMFGDPKFVNDHTIKVDSNTITAKRFIICTGSHPLVPTIEGLNDVEYLTNENIFDLEKLPESLVVLGGGPIGMELSQAFSRLGVIVTVVEMFDRLLFREDEEISDILTGEFFTEGIEVKTGKKAVKVSEEAGRISVTLEDKEGNSSTVSAEKLLVAVGRSPNIKGLDLEKAGVEYSQKGIKTDNTLKTTTKNIYAAGDVTGPYQFSHVAEYQAIIACGNALMPFKRKADYTAVPWCTFTDPELARVGLTEKEAEEKHGEVRVYRAEYKNNDRAVTDKEKKGKAKVICDKKGRILGAHVVGANAGEILHEYVLAKQQGLKISALSGTIHIYPTLAQIVKRTGDASFEALLGAGWFKTFTRLMLKFLR
jgi:dihydrolipoamide dehydrogenase